MLIVTLMENTSSRDDLVAEHGLSLYIEAGGRKILFDSGQTDGFIANAETLGIDLSAVDLAILSHGHYDHSGGFHRFLDINDHAPLYMSQYATSPCYHGSDRYIGIDSQLALSDRVILCEDDVRISDTISLHSCNKMSRPFPVDSAGLTVLQNKEYKDDCFYHEQYLLIKEDGKNVLISGCSHKGILNIAQWFQPDVLIGGFHFMNLDPNTSDKDTLYDAAHNLMKYDTVYYTGHCTGSEQYAYMKQIMGETLHPITCGTTIII